MTEQEAKEIIGSSPEELEARFPWDYPILFLAVPGRYFLGGVSMDVPPSDEHILGGDLTATVWRYQDKPTDWIMIYRFRYYKDGDAFESRDEKSWYSARLSGLTEQTMSRKFEEAFTMMAVASGVIFGAQVPKPSFLWVRGDSDKLMETIQREKPSWMHVKVEPISGNKNPGNV